MRLEGAVRVKEGILGSLETSKVVDFPIIDRVVPGGPRDVETKPVNRTKD